MARTRVAAPPDPGGASLLVVVAGKYTHAVRVIYPDGRSKAVCGAVAIEQSRRRTDAVSALTCPDCRAWAEGTD